ncbi:MAG: hypothetical protein ACRDZT_03900 [Acidimicrobiales bacterium]
MTEGSPAPEGSTGLPVSQPGGEVVPGVGLVEELAAALRADTADLGAYHRALSASVGSLLPEGMVEVDRDRSLSDRLAGRDGKTTAIRLRLGDATLELAAVRGRLVGTVAQDVRGVVISRREITVSEWTEQLAKYLAALAAESASARAALGRLLEG